MSEALDPHLYEEELQQSTEREAARFPNRYELPDAIDDSDLGGNVGGLLPPTLPHGKSAAFYAEGGRMLVEENKALRQVRANKARTDAGLSPEDVK